MKISLIVGSVNNEINMSFTKYTELDFNLEYGNNVQSREETDTKMAIVKLTTIITKHRGNSILLKW
jgi:hypothetical protein